MPGESWLMTVSVTVNSPKSSQPPSSAQASLWSQSTLPALAWSVLTKNTLKQSITTSNTLKK